MGKAFDTFLKQPYWILCLILGATLIALPSITYKDHQLTYQAASTYIPVVVGIVLLIISAATFVYSLLLTGKTEDVGAGVDLKQVKEQNGEFAVRVNDCEIRVVNGRIEDYASKPGTAAVVLPCNEYFSDDLCIGDPRSALGAYVNRVFDGRLTDFIALVGTECEKSLGCAAEQQMTDTRRAKSYGAGRCLLLAKPLGHSVPIALVSTATQRASQGLSAQISYLFTGMQQLVARLADQRIDRVVMPVLGSGHGGINAPLAFVGLLLAVAEAARYGQGSQRLKMVTIILFKRDPDSPSQVDQMVVRRALALVASRD